MKSRKSVIVSGFSLILVDIYSADITETVQHLYIPMSFAFLQKKKKILILLFLLGNHFQNYSNWYHISNYIPEITQPE